MHSRRADPYTVSWYTKGGFVDELGREHHSGHSYNFSYVMSPPPPLSLYVSSFLSAHLPPPCRCRWQF
jgi:hypothetical protein